MKYYFLFAFVLLSKIFNAQKFQLGFNSSLFLSEQNVYSGYNEEQLLPDEITFSNTKGNLGAGYHYGIEIDKFIQSNVTLGLSFESFNSFELLLLNYNRNDLKQHLTASMKQIRLRPKITFFVPVKKFKFLTETSIILPVKTKTNYYFTESNELNDSTRTFSEQYRYNFAFGFGQKIGLEINLSKKVKIKSSLGILLFSQTTKTRNMLNYEINSVNQLDYLTKYDLQTNYFPNLNNYSNNEEYNGTKTIENAKDDLYISHRFSSFEISVSIIYEIFRKKSD